MIDTFIEQKTQQMIFYVSRFLRDRLAHQELHLFVWDTLEEWVQLQHSVIRPNNSTHSPKNYQEQVFWHLLHQLQYWPEPDLRQNCYLRSNIEQCVNFLRGKGHIPADCVGIRP